MHRLRFLLLAMMACFLVPGCAPAQTTERDASVLDTSVDLDTSINNLTHRDRSVRSEALKALDTLGNPAALPALIELLRFNISFDIPVVPVMERLAGEAVGSEWSVWVEWLQQHDDIRPNPGFLAWKSVLFSRLDPNFLLFLSPDTAYRIRIEEIVWGGVRKDGIPALTNPKHVRPQEATYLTPDELVFGVSIHGDHRAYPLRLLDWHEMFNDVVGGKPVTLAY